MKRVTGAAKNLFAVWLLRYTYIFANLIHVHGYFKQTCALELTESVVKIVLPIAELFNACVANTVVTRIATAACYVQNVLIVSLPGSYCGRQR